MGDRNYVLIPGNATHELPPLLVRTPPETPVSMEDVLALVEAEDIIPEPQTQESTDFEQRKFDLAVHLSQQYRGLLNHWQWGDSIVEWIRQCEITFGTRSELRNLLHPDVWPHAGRSSFVTLLTEKESRNVEFQRAVGLRLTFRQPPPIDLFSNQFLFLLNSPVADSAYHAWANLNTDSPAELPPHRFFFQVHELNYPM